MSRNKKFKRLVIGKRVRLRNAYVIEADEAIKDAAGNIVEVRARIIENTFVCFITLCFTQIPIFIGKTFTFNSGFTLYT